MNDDQISALAREYAEEIFKNDESNPDLSIGLLNDIMFEAAADFEEKLRFLLRRFCLVEKSRLKKLDIAYRAKAYDIVVLNKRDVDYIFPEIAKEI